MREEKFTQGDWTVHEFYHEYSKQNLYNIYWSKDGEEVAERVYSKADAHLMAASKEMYRNNEQTLTELEQMIPAMLAVCADCNHRKCKVCQFAKVLKTASEMEMRIEQVQKKARGEG